MDEWVIYLDWVGRWVDGSAQLVEWVGGWKGLDGCFSRRVGVSVGEVDEYT